MKAWSIVKMVLVGMNGAAIALAQAGDAHASFWHGVAGVVAAALGTVIMATGAKDPAQSGAAS